MSVVGFFVEFAVNWPTLSDRLSDAFRGAMPVCRDGFQTSFVPSSFFFNPNLYFIIF